MGLSTADRIKMLEALATDETLKATQRLRAMEELGRIESRMHAQAKPAPVQQDDAPDPMADLDELEAQRQKRARADRGAAVARR
jgi:hypothetical protein